jgi:RNA 2',3'-cyclic 3'-phosphodiesterase
MQRTFDQESEMKTLGHHAVPESDGDWKHGFFLGILLNQQAHDPFENLMCRLKRKHGLRGRPRPAQLLHVSLYSLWRYDGLDENVDRLLDTVRVACANVKRPSFEICVDHVRSFGRGNEKKPIVAVGDEGTKSLIAFHEALGSALEQAGLWVPSRGRFKPHVTLLYDHGFVSEHEVDPISWMVSEFTLMHSNIGKSRYDKIESWPLLSCP